jgi:hypothetical protein
MARHLILSGIFVGLGLGLVVLICTRYDPRPTTIRRFTIAALLTMGLVATLSATATTSSGACPDNPVETCHYNDSTPAMAGVVAVFVIVCAIRSRMIYFER